MIDYIQKGGMLMWPILICSIISIGVFAERLFYFHRATIHVARVFAGICPISLGAGISPKRSMNPPAHRARSRA